MAYTLSHRIHNLVLGGDGTSTSTVGRLPAQTTAFMVHRIGIQVTVAGTTTPVQVTFSKRVTPGVAGTTIDIVIAASATAAAGAIYIIDDLSTLVDIGEELYAAVTTAGGGSLAIDIFAEVSDVPAAVNAAITDGVLVESA